ncbi:substrate-binding periplasmic protein [Paucibacter soli]|uniref:substrate-binding periplasmic protein n=1 Tax=Paucibacter soli TaxID=3133433 RepID=UPI0030ABA9CA
MMNRRVLILAAIGLPHVALARYAVLHISTLADPEPASLASEQLLRDAYRQLGIEIRIERMPGARSLLSANSGATDGELHRKAGLEHDYPNLIRVPVALQQYELVAFARDPDLDVSDWHRLRLLRVAYVRGMRIVEEHLADMQPMPVASLTQAFQMLRRGRVDLVLANRVSGMTIAHSLGADRVVALEPPLAAFPVFHYLNKRHAELADPLAAALRRVLKQHPP